MLPLWMSLIVLATSPQADDPLDPYRGQPVVEVQINAPSTENPRALLDLIGIEPGYLLSQDMLQEAVKRLYALGRFADVRVYAERVQDSVQLHFELKSQRYLETLQFKGLKRADKHALRNALELENGSPIDLNTPIWLSDKAQRYLQSAGFPDATVQGQITQDDANTGLATLRLTIQEGEPHRIKAILFPGTPRVAPEILHGMITTDVGDIADHDRLERDRQHLLAAYRERGFRSVQIEPAQVIDTNQAHSKDHGVTVSYTIHAGDRMAFVFTGNRLLTDADLLGLWPNTDQSYTRGDLQAFQSRIRHTYQRLGYHAVGVTMEGYRDAEQGTIRYMVRIEEGRPLHVTRITFPGAKLWTEKILRAQVASVLQRELADVPVPEHLQPDDMRAAWSQGTAHDQANAAPGSPEWVPIDKRWVESVYSDAVDEIKAAYGYRGYPQALVGTPQLTIVGDEAHVVIPIEEGPEVRVRSITFVGNTSINARTLMRRVETATTSKYAERGGARKDTSLISLAAQDTTAHDLHLDHPLSTGAIEDGRIAVLRAYRNRGYLYTNVFQQVRFTVEPGAQSSTPTVPVQYADITYTIEESPQVRIRTSLVQGNHYTRESMIRRQLTLEPGSVYRLEQAIDDQRSVTSLGVFSSVRVKLIDEERPQELKDLVTEVVERPRHTIEVAPGLSTTDGPRLRVTYNHLNIGGSASTLTTSILLNRQVFFDLYGDYADRMRKRYASYSGLEQLSKALERQIRVGIYSPPIRALPFAPRLRLDFVNERDIAIPYSLDTITTIFGIDMALRRNLALTIEPQVAVTNLECDPSEEVSACRSAVSGRTRYSIDAGLRQTFKIGPTLTWDMRDNPLSPTRGLFAQVKATYTLGNAQDAPATSFSDLWHIRLQKPFSFTRIETNLTGYLPIWRFTLAMSFQGGTIVDHKHNCAPVNERFFLGGRSTLRGYVQNTLLPQDISLVTADSNSGCLTSIQNVVVQDGNTPPVSKGGNHYLMLKSELRIPLISNVIFALFIDAGNLWVRMPTVKNFFSAPRIGTGASIRYNTPVGALAVDFGINPNPRTYETFLPSGLRYTSREATWQLHFSVGTF